VRKSLRASCGALVASAQPLRQDSRLLRRELVVRFDLPSGTLELNQNVVERLRDVAAGMAGHSSAARDLSLILGRALARSGGVALRRAELQTLMEVADAAGLAEIRDRLN
jgi:hypothetical protein